MNPVKNVVGAPNTTLGGLVGVLVAVVGQQVIPAVAAYLGAQPSPIYQVIGSVLGIVVAALMPELSKRFPDPRLPAALLIVAALALPAPAKAQGVPTNGPLAVQVSPDFTLHLNVTIPAFAIDLTNKQIIGQFSFTGIYALDYKGKVAIGLGGSYVQTNDAPGLTATGMLAGPSVQFTDQTRWRLAALGQYQWFGPAHRWLLAVAPTLEF